ncbi:MAG: PAS domain S-box protein, partial [Promethearchaeota archaeon]
MKEKEPLSNRLEDIYGKVLETISEHIVYYDKDFKIIWANKTAVDSLNLTLEQIIGNNCYTLWQGRNKPCEECPVLKTLKFGGVNSKEMVTLDGRRLFIEGYPVFDDINKISGVVEIARDITERRLTEQKLKDFEVKYRNILENMMEGYFETDLMGNFIYANIEYCKIMGYSKEEIVGKNFRLLYDTQSSELLFSMFNQVYKTGIPRPPTGVAKVTTKKKKLIYFEGSIDLLYDSKGNKVGFYGLVRDITKRKIAEQKLKKSEEKYRSLFENMNTGFALHEVIVDDNNKPVDYRYIEVNPAFERFTGIKKENLIGKTVTEAIPGTENDPADWIGKFGNVGLTGIPLTVEDYSEALDRWYKVSGYSPRKGYFAVTFTDITERKKAEDALKESEEKFRTIAEQSFMSIYIIQDGIFKYFNERVPKVNGYSNEEIKNWKPYEFAKLIHPDDRDFVMEQARKKEVGEKGVIKQYRYRIIRKDGEIRWLENFSKTINYKGRPADFIMSIDITEQMNAEKQLKRSEKKYREAFNRSNFYKDLISHDINNILQNILSSVELCSLYLE